MRLASGGNLNDQIDKVWMANSLCQIGPDGLFYWPFFPWVNTPDWGVHYPRRDGPRPDEDYYAIPLFCGRRIGAMTIYHLRDPSGPWNEEIQKIVNGLWSIVIDKGDYAYFPQGEFYPNRPRVRKAAMPVGIWSSLVGWVARNEAIKGSLNITE